MRSPAIYDFALLRLEMKRIKEIRTPEEEQDRLNALEGMTPRDFFTFHLPLRAWKPHRNGAASFHSILKEPTYWARKSPPFHRKDCQQLPVRKSMLSTNCDTSFTQSIDC